ncbi:redoxin domain-containing protein [Hymenobacter metallicola]|uniref:Redoxin domain-containing protein n=1 Tax=Hymenobacter metallicola TaxID=2563114 RepID=A0A4Z0PZW4_9BACT|nr:redoxin domain-containing protein [Hymenobacter metallicola]TGE23257.1 redoxin domain-containing protein [Hymenobacter metallicola]
MNNWASFWRYVCSFWVVLALSGARAAPPTRATVYVFLSDTCPICQSATLTLRQLHSAYASQGVQFVGVFPDQQLRPADLILFGKQYRLPFPLRLDEGQVLTRRFQARITPEVVVAAADGRTVLYQGRIDDSYARLGQRRTVITHHELQDALAAIVAGQPVAQARTEAVGCFITQFRP